MPASPMSIESLLAHARRLHQNGDLGGAKAAYQQILDADPNNPAVLSLLGRLCAQLGDWVVAKKHLADALERAPRHAESLEALAMVNEAQGDLNRADELYQLAAELNPNSANIHNNYGDLLRKLGRLEVGRDHLLKAIELQPRFAIAHNNLGVCMQALKLSQDAEQAFRTALEIDPKHKRARRNLGAVLLETSRFNEATEQLALALALDPNDAETLSQYALALINHHRLAEAADMLRASLRIAPAASQNWVNLGLTQQELGDLDAALVSFNQAIHLAPNDFQAKWHRTFAHFLRGDWAQGWQDYECGIAAGARPGLLANIPVWNGEPLTDKRILLIGEQGLGDEIMFASCVGEIAEHAAFTTLGCDARLTPVFARAFPTVNCVRSGIVKKVSKNDAYDYQILTGSLPRLLRLRATDYPRKAYLQPNPDKLAKWVDRYAELGPGPKVGISWRGGKYYSGEKRSTELASWARLLRTPHAHFISVQYGSTPEELNELTQLSGTPIHHWPDSDPLKEQEDFAAQLSALDLVISVTNATVHLAGALGLNTWTLLSHVPSWRWTLSGETTMWYPNVTLFRQPQRGEWTSVFDQIQQRLETFISHRGNASQPGP